MSDVWDIGFDLSGPPEIRVEPGDYTAGVIDAEVVPLFKESLRLVLHLRLLECEDEGIVLKFIAELPSTAKGKDKTKRLLKLDVGAHSRFARAWTIANGGPPKRADRMKIGVFRDGVFRIRVRDVKVNRHQRALARPYSIVDDILGRLE